jgi:hypothetical protein
VERAGEHLTVYVRRYFLGEFDLDLPRAGSMHLPTL